MNERIPVSAAELVARHNQCTVTLDGYGLSKVEHVYTSGPAQMPSPKVSVNGDGSGVWAAADSYVHIDVEINGNNSGVVIGSNCRLRRLTVRIEGDNCFVIFGAESTTESATVLVAPGGQHIVFGDDCMLSSGVIVRTDDGHAVFDRTTGALLSRPASVDIGPHVWLGNGARVNKGATIGAGTVIGQQSIASGVMEPNSTYAGTPARQLRKDVAWSRTRSFDDIPAYGR